MSKRIWWLAWAALLPALPLAAQRAADRDDDNDPTNAPTPYGVRFTPGMARGLAQIFTKNVLVRHYEMDEAKSEEAREKIARRLMQVAHANEERGQEFIEWAMTEAMRMQSEPNGRRNIGIPPEFAQGVGERMLPLMPVVRDFVDGVVQDVRPMLGIKGQLKLTGELAVAKMGMDAFEKNMQRWSKGEVDPFTDPFEPEGGREVKKDEDGTSRQLKNARGNAAAASDAEPGSEWDHYASEAKKYYDMDPSQAAAVDSLVRDFKARAQIAVGNSEEWKARIYRNRVWWNMSMQMAGRWNNPIREFMDREYNQIREPIEVLGSELKMRIDQVATASQREAAMRRVIDALTEKGLIMDEVTAAAHAEQQEDDE